MKHALLNDYNLVVNHKRVYRLMKEHRFLAVINPLLSIKDKALPERTFMHSDQGGLYTSGIFKELLESNNFIQSLSRKGAPIDNSPIESLLAP